MDLNRKPDTQYINRFIKIVKKHGFVIDNETASKFQTDQFPLHQQVYIYQIATLNISMKSNSLYRKVFINMNEEYSLQIRHLSLLQRNDITLLQTMKSISTFIYDNIEMTAEKQNKKVPNER